jgi:DNA polymerase III subunit epsilon
MNLIFDCETTGLPRNWKAPLSDFSNWPRVIQIAWAFFDPMDRHVESVSHLVRPDGFIIPEQAQRVHGISTETAFAQGKDLKDVLQAFSAVADRARVLVAHNLNFDEKVISAEYLRLNSESPFMGKQRFCTMTQTAEFCAIPGQYGYKWPTMSQLYHKLFGSHFDGAHDAGADVAACARCFFELKRRGIIMI